MRTTAEGECPGRYMPTGIICYLLRMLRPDSRSQVRREVAPRLAGSVLRLLREAVHISCQQVHLVIAKNFFLGRHATVTAVAQGLLYLAET